MASWFEDWKTVTEGWDPVEDRSKFDAIGRLFLAANVEGRIVGRPEKASSPPYRVGE